jgi:uncharacterized membrane protein
MPKPKITSTFKSPKDAWHRYQTWYQHRHASLTPGQRMADAVANGMGSWRFIIWQTIIVIIWIGLNLYGYVKRWDPYPFILLNLLFSTQAAYAAPVIMMSQNRQAERDREQAEADFRTNLEAKAEIEALQVALARIEEEKLDTILKRLPAKKRK